MGEEDLKNWKLLLGPNFQGSTRSHQSQWCSESDAAEDFGRAL